MMVGSEWAQRESALPYSFPAAWEDNEMVPAGSKNQLTDISEKSFRLVNTAGQWVIQKCWLLHKRINIIKPALKEVGVAHAN